ncbi:LysR family transcriptional regulator [Nocardia sp. NPDC050712]|uniref:LysR family transcriptional regulator n=1 Tax=Nocardia sp. NPDC050712 TaxID=3155518 RepID=UPI0033C4D74F
MELRQLRYFSVVAETRHLTRAAEELGIRATSLSQQLLALEKELGTALFDRTPRGMAPTAAAHALLPYAHRALNAAAAGARAAASAGTNQPWRIGVTPGAPPETLAALHAAAADPHTAVGELDAHDLPVSAQLSALRRADLDAALIVLPAATDELEVHVVSDRPLGVLVSTAHPLADRAIEWADLAGQDLLWFDRDLAPGYYDATLDALARAGWRPRRIRVGPPRRALFRAELAQPQVIAIRPRWDESLDGVVWRALPDPPRLRHALVWDAAHPNAARLAELAAHLAAEA